ncbi:uncharacterized protein J3D65DRAFT_672367 [Phyllosticta citribraziliensis]|uniref:C2H2-type domain-containing protein n=1 Tax=Phyllosticta citribraziliensis TaxID=989973 RepID=A0ABR1L6B4_9PEZI
MSAPRSEKCESESEDAGINSDPNLVPAPTRIPTAFSTPRTTNYVNEDTHQHQRQTRMGKPAQRAKKAAKSAKDKAEAEQLKHKCAVCGEAFSLKFQLLAHLRNERHDVPVPLVVRGAGGYHDGKKGHKAKK